MTDIVERLRDWPSCTAVICKEAADEIERLRAALAILGEEVDAHIDDIKLLRETLARRALEGK